MDDYYDPSIKPQRIGAHVGTY